MSMKSISVNITGRSQRYQVRIERGLLDRLGARLRRDAGLSPGTRIALVTDRTVGRLYGARVERSLRKAGGDVTRYTVAPGEPSKDLAVATRLFEAWARDGLGKSAVVVAVGGGVVSDVAGFAAAAFGRGLAWVAVPTTLLAQADAAIGGKTGVNLKAG
jgi:3-dehydroquinate synthase